MSNIQLQALNGNDHIQTRLQEEIDKVLRRLSESDDEITWIITDEYSMVGCRNLVLRKSPAWAIPSCNEIYIDIYLLRSPSNCLAMPAAWLFVPPGVDMLANVIMDELAHIKTGKDHGTKEYDEKLASYRKRYYKPDYLYRLLHGIL